MPASPQNSSSKVTGMPRPLSSIHCSMKKSSEYSPILAASWMMGQGVSSRSSHSAAAGRITDSANPCTQSRTCRTSSLGSGQNPIALSLIAIPPQVLRPAVGAPAPPYGPAGPRPRRP